MSQLHKRLEHLVNYSSQLIFVSSDSIADQQRTLSDFLSLQHESTEVSFFSAAQDLDASDYRRTICRQLADHTVGSFVRPLSDLLSDLDPVKGHYLVCISSAHFIDMSFLNELWEWVTTSRQQQDDLHINVILFAEQAWTESAQSWLPAHHVNKPVLLSSQSVDVVGFDVSALENLMAQKRAFFAGDDVSSIVRKNWFIGSVLLIFVIIFMALVALQYPQELKYFLATGDLPAAPIKQTSTVKAASTDEIDSDLEQTPVQAPNAEALSYESQLEVVNAAITDDLLVSNWPKDDAETATEPLPTPLPEIALEISPRGSEAADKQDFAVPDIVSVQQLDEQLEQVIASDAEAEETVSQINSDSRADTSYLFDEALLLSLPQNQVLLQLSGIQNRTVLAAYLRDNDLEEVTWIYQTERYGGPWYVVLLNQPFASAAAATAAVANLPAKVQQDGPFAKRIAQIQQEIKP